MKKLLICTLFGLLSSIALQAQVETQALCIGETQKIHSKYLDEDRLLNVYLPAGYSSDTMTYPVIYALDGSLHEDFIHLVGLVQFFNLQMALPSCIVVGIANVDRKRDFTFPTTIKEQKDKYPTTGNSDKFIAFMTKEMLPFIEHTYKTNGQRTMIGQSLGGLLATELLSQQGNLFQHYIIVSPSLWWDNESLLRQLPELLAKTALENMKVTVCVGKEGRIMVREAKGLYRKLKSIKAKGFSSRFIYLPDTDHGDILHKAVYKALE